MIDQVSRYLRRIAARDPMFSLGPSLDKDVTVINIENIDEGTMVFDLDDGTTIRIDYERYTR